MNFVSMIEPPRVVAARIAKLKTREERRAALDQVPAAYRELVKAQVTNTLLLARHWRDRIAANPATPVPQSVRDLLDALS